MYKKEKGEEVKLEKKRKEKGNVIKARIKERGKMERINQKKIRKKRICEEGRKKETEIEKIYFFFLIPFNFLVV